MSTAQSPLRILLVDDDADDRLLVADLFETLDDAACYQVDSVASYEAALAKLSANHYDAALIDFQLGAHTGVDLLKASADLPRRPPMIVLTGHSSAEVDALCLHAGAADFLVKAGLYAKTLQRSLRYAVERHRLGLALADRERDYRVLFEHNPIPMLINDPINLHITAANQAAIEQYGYRREELLTLTASDLRSPEQAARFLAFRKDHATIEGMLDAGTWQHRRKDGSVLYVDVTLTDLEIDGNAVRLALLPDVSARIAAETALKTSEATLRQVLDDLGDGLMVVSDDCRMLFANPVASSLLGLAKDEGVGAPLPASFSNAIGERIELNDPSGTTHLIDLHSNGTNWQGQAAHILTLHDVTRQTADARQLAMLKRAVEAADEGVLIVDAQVPGLPIVYANPAFEKITGYPANEVLGRNCDFLQGADHDQPELEMIQSAIRTQQSCVVTLRNYRRDGGLFWNRLGISPVLDDFGNVTHVVATQTDMTEQVALQAEREHLISHDPVSGLQRHASAGPLLNKLLDDARSLGQRLVLLFVNLDRFSSINDTLGFVIGDAALKAIAERLREAVGSTGQALHHAGNEFVLAINRIDPATALQQLGDALCIAIAAPLRIDDHTTLYLTASVGLAAYPDSGDSVLALARQAELASRQAKQSGRNAAVVFSHDMLASMENRQLLGGQLRDALHRNEFVLHYQPQVNAQSGALIGLEALIRWNSPEFGLLPPNQFIPIAEDSGLILQIGAWVLREACRQIRQWHDAGFKHFIVGVNVSAVQMQRTDFVEVVRRTIIDTGIDPAMLELELTESTFMDNADRAVQQMQSLKRLGVNLSLDDFGTGYSSLAYLQHFPLDKLKIDQSFIADITSDGTDAVLVRTMITIGHHLGLCVVAEGVETEAQCSYLRRHHCDEFQGHLFSPAVTAEAVPELLQGHTFASRDGGLGEHRRCLLIVDDEDNIRRSLLRLLRRDGYQLLEASSAAEGFELLAKHDVQVILSDQRMPVMSGTEFLSRVKEIYPDTVRMVLSGFTELSSVTEAINRGALYKFLTKPWDDADLRGQVADAFRRYELTSGQRPGGANIPTIGSSDHGN
jgi:diguanylate cyclase (GGDEF)-like protein/PAS domain S-box-containing protein